MRYENSNCTTSDPPAIFIFFLFFSFYGPKWALQIMISAWNLCSACLAPRFFLQLSRWAEHGVDLGTVAQPARPLLPTFLPVGFADYDFSLESLLSSLFFSCNCLGGLSKESTLAPLLSLPGPCCPPFSSCSPTYAFHLYSSIPPCPWPRCSHHVIPSATFSAGSRFYSSANGTALRATSTAAPTSRCSGLPWPDGHAVRKVGQALLRAVRGHLLAQALAARRLLCTLFPHLLFLV
jgi:hypothetical protein